MGEFVDGYDLSLSRFCLFVARICNHAGPPSCAYHSAHESGEGRAVHQRRIFVPSEEGVGLEYGDLAEGVFGSSRAGWERLSCARELCSAESGAEGIV